jgi:hypothetical protein
VIRVVGLHCGNGFCPCAYWILYRIERESPV